MDDEYQVDALANVLRHDLNRQQEHWRATLSDLNADRLHGAEALVGTARDPSQTYPTVRKDYSAYGPHSHGRQPRR